MTNRSSDQLERVRRPRGAWLAGLIVAVVIGIAVAIAVSNQRPAAEASPTPSTAIAVVPTSSPTSAPVAATNGPTAALSTLSPTPTPTSTSTPSSIPTPPPSSIPTPPPMSTPSSPPNSTASPTPSPTPDPLASPTGLRWEVALENLGDPRHYLSPITWSRGFAALDARIRTQGRLWLSGDGRQWTSHRLPFVPTQFGTQLLAFRDGLVLAALYGDVRSTRFDVWVSRDGATWHHRGLITTSANTPGFVSGGNLVALGDRLAIVGYIGPNTCCGARPGLIAGLPAAVDVAGSAAATPRNGRAAARSELGAWAWTSTDGRVWMKERIRGVGTDGVAVYGATSEGYFGIRNNGGSAWIVRSVDGIHWRTFARLPNEVDLYAVYDLVTTADGYVLAADTGEAHHIGEGPYLTIWHVSSDGVFTDVLDQTGRQAWGLAAEGATVVLASYQYHGLSGRTDPLALVSHDSGATFELSAGWPALAGTDCLRDVVIHDHTAVAAGGCDVRNGPTLFVAELP